MSGTDNTEVERVCGVVDQFCTAPANLLLASARPLRARCYACGGAVCVKCSSLRTYHDLGRVRLCNTCQVEYDGDDSVVMRRLSKLAGY